MINMKKRRSYHFLASAVLMLLLAITMAVSPTAAAKRCARPNGNQKGKGCEAGEECVDTGALYDWAGSSYKPRCRTLSDDCLKQCKSGYVCVEYGHSGKQKGCKKLAIY